jgi:hypothetical protein
MQKLIMAGTVLTLLTTVSKAGDLTFTTINNTNQNIVAMWISPHANSNWDSADESDNVYIRHGGGSQTTTFDSPAYGSSCFEDIRYQFSGGEFWNVLNVNLCNVSVITIDADRNHKVTYTTR